MANIIRHTAVWSGSPGLPGYSQFYQGVEGSIATAAQDGHDRVASFFEILGGLIPSDITVTVDPVYAVIDDVTGELQAEQTVGDPAAVIGGTYVSGWQSQVGVLIEWVTGVYTAGRRLRGRTYLVPLGNTYDDDGTLPQGTIDTVTSAAAYITADPGNFEVWHRPVNGAGGFGASISGAVIRDKACILRSRMN